MNIILKSKLTVPIYNVDVWLVVATNPVTVYQRSRRFSDAKDAGEFRSLCAWNDKGDFGLFFPRDLNTEDIGHEIKHLADQIMRYIGNPTGSEASAYLTGYLTEWVHKKLRRGGVRLR